MRSERLSEARQHWKRPIDGTMEERRCPKSGDEASQGKRWGLSLERKLMWHSRNRWREVDLFILEAKGSRVSGTHNL